MSLVSVLTILIATAPDADAMHDLEGDMAAGHAAAAREQEHAPEVSTASDIADRPMHRQGFTFELGLGVGGTNDYADPDHRVAGVFAASIGSFLNDRTALLLHFAGASNAQDDAATVSGQAADRYHGITSLFLGPQLQWFPVDRLMLAFGVGGVARVDAVRVDIHGTTAGDTHDAKTVGGIGASARAAFTVYQRKDAAAVRLGIEALPSYVGSTWHTSIAFMGELQAF